MANQNSAKGNPASKRMSNPNNKAKRVRNKNTNESLKAKNQHPKQLRNAANQMLHITKEHHGGLDRAERRYLEKHYPGELAMNFTGAISSDERRRRGENLRAVVKLDKRIKKRVARQPHKHTMYVGLTYLTRDKNFKEILLEKSYCTGCSETRIKYVGVE